MLQKRLAAGQPVPVDGGQRINAVVYLDGEVRRLQGMLLGW
jgi:hypothetical protein